MGFEITYVYHPRKEEGGYNTEIKDEKTVKVGKPFDDTPLEKCAAAIMMQLARRDIWVVDVKVYELVKSEISFKESVDGKGILLKNKKYSLGSTAEAMAEDLVEETPPQILALPQGVQPHELLAPPRNDLDDLYSATKPVPIRKLPTPPVNQNKVLYHVYYEPEIVYLNEAKRLNLKFSADRKYPVHQIVPHPSGNLGMQKIVVTDDTGKPITVDEKFFTSAGRGLLADEQLGFSGSSGRQANKKKLMYENELVLDSPQDIPPTGYKQIRKPNGAASAGIPVDDGSIPAEMMAVPDLRPGRKLA